MFRGNSAGHRHCGCRTEQTEIDAAGGELRRACGNRQVACGNELAASGRRDAVHSGDHGLWQIGQRQHDTATKVKEGALPADVRMSLHFTQVMARTKRFACTCDHNYTSACVARDLIERALQRCQHGARESVVLLRAVQRQRSDATALFAFDQRFFSLRLSTFF